MDLPELLDRLDDPTVELTHTTHGELQLRAPKQILDDPAICEAITRHKPLLIAHLDGLRTGHPAGICDKCRAVSLTHYNPRGTHPKCRMTPGCPGRHRPRPADIQRCTTAGAPPAPKQPKPPPHQPRQRLCGTWPTYPTPPNPPTRTPDEEPPAPPLLTHRAEPTPPTHNHPCTHCGTRPAASFARGLCVKCSSDEALR